ncbi:MAG TPA: hypothetical protein VFQ61_20365 [Polyangiaceae bacterium]|nr:hypothetical protein [Polyangiaceae bacterium]
MTCAAPHGAKYAWASGSGLLRSYRGQIQQLYRKANGVVLAIALPIAVALPLSVSQGCASSEPPRREREALRQDLCPADSVRQFHCDDLLPRPKSQEGAPAPYELCPAGIQVPLTDGYPANQSVAEFDVPYTEWARRRVSPGHACCYSWCAALPPADPEDVPPEAGCAEPSVTRESYCLPELERGSSIAASEPFERCPMVIHPPAGQFFSVPKAAPLDPQATAGKRGAGEEVCCYAWCSRMPAGILK